jgi:hypothetical protein
VDLCGIGCVQRLETDLDLYWIGDMFSVSHVIVVFKIFAIKSILFIYVIFMFNLDVKPLHSLFLSTYNTTKR